MNDGIKKLLKKFGGKLDNLASEVTGIKQITQNLTAGLVKLQYSVKALPTKDEFDQFKDNVYNKMDAAYKEIITVRN